MAKPMATFTIRRSRMQGEFAFMAKVEAAAQAEGCEVGDWHTVGYANGTDVVMELVGPDADIVELKSMDYLGLL